MSQVKFETLRVANKIRLPHFKNSKGVLAHSKADGSDWTLLEWAGALAGEVGELANFVKKVRRGDRTLDEARADISKELADCVIYLDILATQCGVNLGEAVQAKFNETSRKTGVGVFIEGAVITSTELGDRPLNPHYYTKDHADFRPTDSGEFPHAPGNYAAERAATDHVEHGAHGRG